MRWLLLLSIFVVDTRGALAQGPSTGAPAPAFSLRNREGTLVSRAGLAHPGPATPARPKQVVLLDFFRTDCEPCRRGLKQLIHLHRTHGGQGLKVILVALLEEEQGEEKLQRFLSQTPLPFDVLLDPYGVAARRDVMQGKTVLLPQLFVIDREGVLRGRFTGIDPKKPDALQQLVVSTLLGPR